MKHNIQSVLLGCWLLTGCSMTQPQASADLSTAFTVAAAGEAAYASRPGANAKTVAQMSQLLAAAQAALASWESSSAPADQAALAAALAALVAYEASAKAG